MHWVELSVLARSDRKTEMYGRFDGEGGLHMDVVSKMHVFFGRKKSRLVDYVEVVSQVSKIYTK